MEHVRCFAPIENPDAHILILGSMPGIASLRAGQYYAHPQNLFWRIMGELVGAGPGLSYEQRIAALRAANIALWDVLCSCERKGSLDSDIERNSLVANDFASFFRRHPNLTHVFFNGAKAEECYRKHVLSSPGIPPLEYTRLPSTSPANAGIPYERKLEAWRVVLRAASIMKTSTASRAVAGHIG